MPRSSPESVPDARTKALELIAGRSGTAAQALSVPGLTARLDGPAPMRGRTTQNCESSRVKVSACLASLIVASTLF